VSPSDSATNAHDIRDAPDDESHDRFPSSLAVGIPACTPESFAGQGACSLNSPPHPARGEGSFVSGVRDFHVKQATTTQSASVPDATARMDLEREPA